MNEAETRAELIDPALREAGWGELPGSRVRREYKLSQGRLIGQGQRAQKEIADYVLQYKNQNLAIIEAKAKSKGPTEGLTQAKAYAEKLKVRFTYSTNGKEIYQVDMQGKEGPVDRYPTPDELWQLSQQQANDWRDKLLDIPFEDRSGTWQPRYYQELAVQRVIEAISDNKDRILLTLATGTGKTAIAFQIAWKLFQAKWNLQMDGNRRPRILFLADRNILADQAFNAFNFFEDDALVRIRPEDIKKKGRVPKNGSIFFTIFQTFRSGPEHSPYFGEYPKDYFDFIIIDECHRGGANEESRWRAIMEYFEPAVQLGLTATPKRKINADTYSYFGEPVYIYSLKEGINDGYLTPFRVVQFDTTIDEYTYTADDELLEGEVEQGKQYTEQDFNRIIEIKQREEYRVNLLLERINQDQKTLVFCATQPHAAAIRDLISQKAKSKNPNYCHRVTADDGERGEQHLRSFQDNEKSIPTVLTTSVKLSTGVDAPEVRNIVLLRPVNSMIEFKQIVGRGTRLFEGKDYFTIWDFVEAHKHFQDPEWDGEPVEPGEPGVKTPPPPYPPPPQPPKPGEPPSPPNYVRIELSDGKYRELDHMVQTTFWDPDGKPISSKEFLQRLYGAIPEVFKNEQELREIWSQPDTRKKLLQELESLGYAKPQLQELQKLIHAEESDLYDVLAYVAYNNDPIERVKRAESALIHLGSYDRNQQEFLNFVLTQYIKAGVDELDDQKLPDLLDLQYGGVSEAKEVLGGIPQIREAFIGFQKFLYSSKTA